MRLSGGYIDRLLISVFPGALLACGIIYLAVQDIEACCYSLIILTGILWVLDTAVIFFKYKNPRPLSFSSTLKWNRRRLLSDEIEQITPITDNPRRWSVDVIQFVLKNGEEFYIIDKQRPMLIGLFWEKSRSIEKIIRHCPELAGKVSRRKFI